MRNIPMVNGHKKGCALALKLYDSQTTLKLYDSQTTNTKYKQYSS